MKIVRAADFRATGSTNSDARPKMASKEARGTISLF